MVQGRWSALVFCLSLDESSLKEFLVVEMMSVLVWFGFTNGARDEANKNTDYGGSGARLS